ncbi:PASTA domain-containing protein [Pseudonocardia sp. C8]|uniref:PASTA domain-containing protein n=1 Tax=Pseudonocardia sp. C8 TaxID=2762759 RepID=UPI001642B44D|nr:PASTA domain-containing protein [Pseudonocardia sp. C8]MBC3190986.1 PASTA domain-containing protein [Pseudonocardia sp. C8]
MRKIALLPIALIAAAALAGCGSSAEESFEEGFRAGQQNAAPTTAAAAASPTAPPVTDVTIPDVEGKNGAIALDELEQAGLTNVQPASRDKEDKVVLNAANWTVTKIEPGAGETVRSDSTVVVTMTKQG